MSEQQTPTISALLVVHHEEAYIRECIESFADLVDEIVVLHDGPCADRTLEIAREYTEQIHETVDRAGSAEFIRPLGLSHCNCDWVLVIDADERLTPALRASIPELLRDTDADAWGFSWPYVDQHGQSVTRHSVSGKKFLFRRSRMYTLGLPHMTPETYGNAKSRGDLAVAHLMKPGSDRGQLRRVFRQNRRRGRMMAARLSPEPPDVLTFQAELDDPRVSNTRKIRLFRRHPMFALVTVPVYGFLHWYFARGYFRAGIIGLHDALNLPLCHFWTCASLIRRRRDSGRLREGNAGSREDPKDTDRT